jgi:hypothetical protein
MVIVGARPLRRVEDCPGSSFGRGSDIVGVFIQCATHAWHRDDSSCKKRRENDKSSPNS